MSDLISNHVPFVCIPLGADQPLLAARAVELGASISLDAKNMDAKQIREAVDKVFNDSVYLSNTIKINDSYLAAGGYPEAVKQIFKFLER